MRPDFPDMTEPTYILFDGKARVGRSKLHRVPVEDFFNSLLGLSGPDEKPSARSSPFRAGSLSLAKARFSKKLGYPIPRIVES